MPEAAINKHGNARAHEYDVGTTGKAMTAKSIPQTARPDGLAQETLWPRVPAADAGHLL